MLRFNGKSVTIPFFQVGVAPVDLPATIESVRRVLKAQGREK